MIDFLWNMVQQRRIDELEDRVAGAQSSASLGSSEQRAQVAELQRRVDALTLTVSALYELLEKRGALTKEQLAQKITEIDARDGSIDGKMTHGVKPCAACGRTIHAKFARCVYCGGERIKT
jgi:hypothetical protein